MHRRMILRIEEKKSIKGKKNQETPCLGGGL